VSVYPLHHQRHGTQPDNRHKHKQLKNMCSSLWLGSLLVVHWTSHWFDFLKEQEGKARGIFKERERKKEGRKEEKGKWSSSTSSILL